jgi:hypothetical protein
MYFVGTEAEGPRRGMRTLFIRGDAKELPEYMVHLDVDQIYLGAGNVRGAHPELVQRLCSFAHSCCITIEFDDIMQLALITPYLEKLPRLRCVFVIDTANSLANIGAISDIKIVNEEELYWFSTSVPYHTMLDDELYSKDEELIPWTE